MSDHFGSLRLITFWFYNNISCKRCKQCKPVYSVYKVYKPGQINSYWVNCFISRSLRSKPDLISSVFARLSSTLKTLKVVPGILCAIAVTFCCHLSKALTSGNK